MRILLLLAMSCVMGLSLPSESQAFGRRTRNTFTPVPMCVCPQATHPTYAAAAPVIDQTRVATSANYDSRSDLVLCGGRPIPPGYVLIGQTTVFSCGGSGNNNAMVLRKLPTASGSQITICGNQPIPIGWVMVGQTTVFSCGGTGNNNALIIRKL